METKTIVSIPPETNLLLKTEGKASPTRLDTIPINSLYSLIKNHIAPLISKSDINCLVKTCIPLYNIRLYNGILPYLTFPSSALEEEELPIYTINTKVPETQQRLVHKTAPFIKEFAISIKPRLGELPKFIEALSSFTKLQALHLYFEDNTVETAGVTGVYVSALSTLKNLESLKSLIIYSELLPALPATLAKLTSFKHLVLVRQNLQYIPKTAATLIPIDPPQTKEDYDEEHSKTSPRSLASSETRSTTSSQKSHNSADDEHEVYTSSIGGTHQPSPLSRSNDQHLRTISEEKKLESSSSSNNSLNSSKKPDTVANTHRFDGNGTNYSEWANITAPTPRFITGRSLSSPPTIEEKSSVPSSQ